MLRQRGKKWYYTIETRDQYGRRRRVERAGTEDKMETKKLARKAQAEYDASLRIKSGLNVTYGRLLNEWKASLPRSGLKANTVKRYESIIEKHLQPALGNLPIKRITPIMLQRYLESIPLGYSSLNSICAAIKKSFTFAVVMCEYLPVSPAEYLHAPRTIKEEKESDVFDLKEIHQIFTRFGGQDMGRAIYLSYYTGLRIGECCSLSWGDVDLAQGEIRVRTTLIDDHGWTVQPIPKSKRSIRTVQIPDKLRDLLSAWRLQSMEQRMKYGAYYRGQDFVACRENGEGLTPDNFRYFNRWCKETFGHGSFHTLRHTYATALLEHGADLELVSKQLGHSTIAITAQVYSHVLDRRKTKLTNVLNRAL